MEGTEKPTLNTKEVTEQWPKFEGKKRASMADNWVQKTIVTYYHVYYDLCKPRCIYDNLDQFVVNYFCEPINNNYNRVVTVFFQID